MNKIITISMTVILIFTLVMYGSLESSATGNRPIDDMLKVFEKNNIAIDEWSFYAKENITTVHDYTDFLELVQLKQTQTDNRFNWSITEEEDKWVATGIYTDTEKTETIKILSTPINQKSYTYLVYDAKGTQLDRDLVDSFYNSFESTMNDIFLENPTIFTCLKGEYSDRIEGVLYNQVDYLLEEFNADEIEATKEETFVSVSAYTDNWKNDIPTLNEKMNIQIALRNSGLGSATTIVVGTPIITSEY
ncbi:YwmB family TATA-box binding protein [Cytobacillus suaedae]|nr:YwmB family TATA-box binding protein [Cytobacillus suaedae]